MPTAFDVRALTSTVRIELDDSFSPTEQRVDHGRTGST